VTGDWWGLASQLSTPPFCVGLLLTASSTACILHGRFRVIKLAALRPVPMRSARRTTSKAQPAKRLSFVSMPLQLDSGFFHRSANGSGRKSAGGGALRRVRIHTGLFPGCQCHHAESERRAGTRLATAFHGHCELGQSTAAP
jgi:hypothetical protein